MSPLKVKVNTLFHNSLKPYIDPLSKCYIVIESLMGLNRLPLILKGHRYFFSFSSLACILSMLLSFGVMFMSKPKTLEIGSFSGWVSLYTEFTFSIIFSFVTWKRMDQYYQEINKFDVETGCRPKVTSDVVWNFIVMLICTVLIFFFHTYLMTVVRKLPINITTAFSIVDMIHCMELFFHGHLLSLLVARLRLINYYMESTLANGTMAKRPDVEEFISFKNKNTKNTGMKELKDLYHIVIGSHDSLINAIKWQMLVIIVALFIRTLSISYMRVLRIVRNEISPVSIIIFISLTILQLLPLFSPCIFGDRVHGEVKRLRELIASRLYEKKLEKSGRNIARALLTLTEARDLSFSLLRMLQVDVSLPFKFIGLLVTYLIILVQFDKVINFSLTPAS